MSQNTYLSKYRNSRITFSRILNSEWIKFRSIRSNWIVLFTTVLVIVGCSVLTATLSHHRNGAPLSDVMDRILIGVNLSVLIISIFGGVLGAREYGSGMIKSSFSAVPRRLPILIGKVVIFVMTTTPILVISILVAFFLGSTLFKDRGTVVPAFGDPFIARSLFGYAFYVLGLGLFGLLIGMLTRQAVLAIAITVGGIIFFPAILSAILPNSWQAVLKYLPSNAGGAFDSPVAHNANLLSPTWGGVVFVLWIIGVFVLTSYALVSRDV